MRTLLGAVVGVMLAGGVPLAAQGDWQEIQPKRTRDYDDRKSEGYCAIRVWVDDLVIIHTRGNRVAFETVRGQRAKDAGTECSQPLPGADAISDFRFRGIDGRGRVELLEEPDRRNRFTAIVRIEDPRSGGQEHHFRLTWRNLRPGSAPGGDWGGWGRGTASDQGNQPPGGGWGQGSASDQGNQPPGGGWGRGGRQDDRQQSGRWNTGSSRRGSGATWSGPANFQDIRVQERGRGTFELRNGRQQRLDEVKVEIQRDGQAFVEFRGGQNPVFRGRVTEQRGDEFTIRVERYGWEDADGEARVQMRSGRVQRVEIRGEERRSRNEFRADFQSN
ncbi:MAG: hypothetical protein KJZ84_06310 [Bryobacteraceae bacterium]|nr:hypothetical protein [Bryobacteraceae bacterium]